MLDAVIVGGSVAGLSAALYLGRSRRRVMIFDTGEPCNRFSHAAHGFLTRDHILPAELLRIGYEQLARYSTIQSQMGRVIRVEPRVGHFEVFVENGTTVVARKVLLATGVRDELPPVPGIEHLWGRSVFHCAYCDGWEQRDQPVAIYANGVVGLHVARLMRNLTDNLVICTNGPAEFSQEDHVRLEAHGVRVIETPVAHLKSEGDQLREIVFADGSVLPRNALFIHPHSRQHSPLANELGCTSDEWGLIQVDERGHTSVAGVYAAGDMTTRFRQVVVAAKSGALAGASINADLVEEDFA